MIVSDFNELPLSHSSQQLKKNSNNPRCSCSIELQLDVTAKKLDDLEKSFLSKVSTINSFNDEQEQEQSIISNDSNSNSKSNSFYSTDNNANATTTESATIEATIATIISRTTAGTQPTSRPPGGLVVPPNISSKLQQSNTWMQLSPTPNTR